MLKDTGAKHTAMRCQQFTAASDYAWASRNDHLQGTWPDLAQTLNTSTTQEIRYWIAVTARRLQYQFAYPRLHDFLSAVPEQLAREPHLKFLTTAANAYLAGTNELWEDLITAAENATTDCKITDIALTTVFTGRYVPDTVMVRALTIASTPANMMDPVMAYRRVSLLRRMGRYDDAWAALDLAHVVLTTVPGALAEHLSERLVSERLLLQTIDTTVMG